MDRSKVRKRKEGRGCGGGIWGKGTLHLTATFALSPPDMELRTFKTGSSVRHAAVKLIMESTVNHQAASVSHNFAREKNSQSGFEPWSIYFPAECLDDWLAPSTIIPFCEASFAADAVPPSLWLQHVGV